MTTPRTDPPASGKLRPWHLDRAAIVSIRPSTPRQVLDHQESTTRPSALAERAVALGWPRSQVQVIDDDLGKSGQAIEGRPGFQRRLAEVALDRVGLILGLEMSRLARSCKDWHHLLELCARFRVLLADADGVHDPTESADRLVLGLTGMMSEAELHILKQRMCQGKLNQARRGEGVRAGAPAGGPDPGAALGGGVALRAVPPWEAEFERFVRSPPRLLGATDRERIRRLAREVPALWRASTTTPADRRQVVRLVVDRVVLTVDPHEDRVAVGVEWAGGWGDPRTDDPPRGEGR